MSDATTLLLADAAPSAASRTLSDSARPLMALATRLKRAVAVEADNMRQGLVVAVGRFERDLAAAGWPERDISAASYLLCAWVDEMVADTPWGEHQPGLLQRFHGEPAGGDKLMKLLSHLASKPRENRALLELFHACLSLGLAGPLRSQPDAAQRLATLRERLYRALPEPPLVLASPWRNAVAELPPPLRRRWVVAVLVGLGLAALLAYTTSHVVLGRRADQVFAGLQQLMPAPQAAPEPAAEPRLAGALAAEAAAGRLVVRDERHRSVLSVPAEVLFGTNGMRLSAQGEALLQRVGSVLAPLGGRLVVVGHTDGTDSRSARLPSAWHQSFEWAREVGVTLVRGLPQMRLAVEGAADSVAPGEAALPRRRVDIVFYP